MTDVLEEAFFANYVDEKESTIVCCSAFTDEDIISWVRRAGPVHEDKA